MKNLAKRISAFLTTAVITVSAAGISAFATPAPDPDDGWRKTDDGWTYWHYSTEHTPHYHSVKNANFEVDDILYRFNKNGICTGKYSGTVKENDVSRRYENGLPYTGWTKNSGGSWKYYLDGYSVIGDFQIGNIIYNFDKNGVYTGKASTAKFSADVVGTISTDTKEITVTVSTADKSGKKYSAGNPYRMERWENGRWTDCKKNDELYGINANEVIFSYGNSNTASAFYPQDYTRENVTEENFTAGYYRITLSCWETGKYDATAQDIYAVFEVVPPVTLEFRKDIYISDGRFDVPVETVVNINSEKLKKYYSQHPDEISVEFDYHRTDYWGPINTYDSDTIIEAEAYENDKPMKVYLTDIVSGVNSAGHYRTVVTIDGKKYKKEFRIDKLRSESWLDEYYLKDDSLTISFTLFNNTNKDMTIEPYVYYIYEKKNGKWVGVESKVVVEAAIGEEILKPGEKIAIEYPIWQYYDMSELKPGTYAINIGGWGYAEFKLTDEKPDTSKIPYANLSPDNIKNVQINQEFSGGEKLSAEFTGYEAIKMANRLRQIVLTGENAEEYLSQAAGTFNYKIKITYKDGKTKIVTFHSNNIIEYDRTAVFCGANPYRAIEDVLIENSDVDRNYYGYRRN